VVGRRIIRIDQTGFSVAREAQFHAMIDASVVELAPVIGTAAACRVLSTSRSGVYRRGHRGR
jgi:hypothetical protein